MAHYGLGIDAGGTYTDTVIIDLDTGKFICGNKALTTRHDLSVGIRESLTGLNAPCLKSVSLVSLSSTLATNSVVENKGCRVGLITIGTGYSQTTVPDHYFQVGGRFCMSGKEEIPLDTDAVKTALEEMKGEADAVAVSGYLSVRNPSHEETVREMVKDILDVPVACAHDLTSKLGFEQRTTTAVMNARLIPVIEELLASVRAILGEYGISCPLMVVKGDGALMKDEAAAAKPVETILSGPASSLMGAKSLTGEMDAVMIDIGGTTSDIGILRNGFPRMEPEGASIAGKRTMVMAADIATYGIGGDSRILVNGKEIVLSSVRVIPLCIAARRWPEVLDTLRSLEGITDDRAPEDYDVEEIIQETEFFTLTHRPSAAGISETDAALLDLAGERPIRLSDAGRGLDVPAHAFSASELESRGHLTRIGVTPTDILHAEGSYDRYDAEASRIAIGYLARKCGMTAEEFIPQVKERIARKIAACTMDKMFLDASGKNELSPAEKEIIRRTLHEDTEGYSLGFTLKHPIIGIGAPVGAWLPRVAEILNTRLLLPEHSEIGNAFGAINGSVSESVTITVRASGDDYIECPACDVFTGRSVEHFDSPNDAMEYARTESARMAAEAATRSGSRIHVVDVSEEENVFEMEGKRYFRGAAVTARATGKPDLA